MTLSETIRHHFSDHYVVLVLDNEVTVDAFVTDPPKPWLRLVQTDGVFGPAADAPCVLTDAQAYAEARLWDHVSGLALIRNLAEADHGIDRLVFGNNAGQGLALAECLPKALRADRGAVIYAEFLPEQAQYEALGFTGYLRRQDLVAQAEEWAAASGQPLALAFINTIQHDETNFHTP